MTPRTPPQPTDRTTFLSDMRSALLATRRSIEARLRRHLAGTREGVDDRTSGDDGVAQSTDADVQQFVSFAVMEASSDVLVRIDHALRRLDEDLYGRCIECDDAISPARLRALPFALRCLDCERHREREPGAPAHRTPDAAPTRVARGRPGQTAARPRAASIRLPAQ